MRRRAGVVILGFAVLAAVAAFVAARISRPDLVLTGIVTTNDVVVSPLVSGEVSRLLVTEGDTVRRGQLLATIRPDELRADLAYYGHTAEGARAQVEQGRAALRYQQEETTDQIRQGEAGLAAVQAQQKEAEAALENTRLVFERTERLSKTGVASAQDLDQARTAYEAALAHVAAANKQVDAQRATLELARANREQVALKREQLVGNEREAAAAAAQQQKADVRLAYTEIRAPIDGVGDVRAVRQGEVVNPGQAVLTLVNPDDLWVRADVEETYIDSVRLGQTLTVRLPSGVERPGIVFYRAVDAAFATQRDVSRTKRDIKTFEVRLRVDNADRRLAVGMTAYVLLPVPR
jgi:multidrug resistance efflux pump